ncbi:MAG: outer membrane protein assembly factor BamA [Nitrospinae bacterium]|nr:outer membrane protein assembly factor BamA [Nitrospinota bacterium]
MNPFRSVGRRVGALLLFACTLLPGSAYALDYFKNIKDIRVVGIERADQNTVRYYIHSKKGDVYNADTVAEDIRRLYKLGFFDDISLDLVEETDGLVLTYLFAEKPFIRQIKLEGISEIKDKEILLRVKTQKGTFFRQDLIPWDETRIQQVYRNKGFYFTDVKTVVRRLPDNLVDVDFLIDEGKKINVARIDFRDATRFSPQTLRGQIETSAVSWSSFLSDSGAYKKNALKTDLLKLESYYHDHGYIKARFDDPEVEIDKEWRSIYITFPLTEGEQYRVGDITVQGDDIYTEEELREKLTLVKGDVFNKTQFRQDIFAITDLYAQKGYAYANVIPQLDINEGDKLVNIAVRTEKGRKIYIGAITITGNEETRDRIIRRQFRLQEGELFDSAKLRRSRERINQLGFFNSVDIEQRSAAEEDTVDIETKVDEMNTGQISFAVGYSSVESVLVQGSVKWKNLDGRGQEFGVTVDHSARRDDYSLNFTEPAIFDREILGGIDLYNKTYEYDAYKSVTTGGSLRLGRSLSEYIWAKLGYKYELAEVQILNRDTASSYLLLQEGRLTTGSLFPSLTYDSRNDPYSPDQGTKLYLYAEGSGFGGDARFYRLIGEWSNYQHLWNEFIGMGHLKIGRAAGYEGKPLPITERFFMGGPSSLRGFTIRDIGPKDIRGEAIGGEASLLLNVELQYRFTRFFRGFLFYDRGNVYGDNDEVGNTTDQLYDLENMRHSWGFGVHFFSPIGPITMAYGFKLDQREGESPNEFHFTIGGAF